MSSRTMNANNDPWRVGQSCLGRTLPLLLLVAISGAANAVEVVDLTGDAANSSAPGFDTDIVNTVNDGFAYDPLIPANPLPNQAHPNGFHGNEADGVDVILGYDLTNGALTIGAGELFAIDLYGRNECCQDRDDDIDIELYSGGVTGTLVRSVTGVAIPDTAPTHQRAFVGQVGDTFDAIRIVGHDSEPVAGNFFTLQEIRAALIDDNFNRLTINRQTGAVSFFNNSDTDVGIIGYSLTSAAGSFDQSNWTTVAGNYDSTGNDLVDADDDWSVLTGAGVSTDLSEAELEGGDGGRLPSGSLVDLGTPWVASPFEDVVAEILLTDGTVDIVPVTYEGTPIEFGDLNADGEIDALDWSAFKAGYRSDFAGLSEVQAYQLGDLDGDFDQDLRDFGLFEVAFDEANGAGAFSALLASTSVPEPAGVVVISLLACAGSAVCRQRAGGALLASVIR